MMARVGAVAEPSEKAPECSLVFGLPAPVSKAGSKLAQHHERQQDGLGFLQQRHRLLVPRFAETFRGR